MSKRTTAAEAQDAEGQDVRNYLRQNLGRLPDRTYTKFPGPSASDQQNWTADRAKRPLVKMHSDWQRHVWGKLEGGRGLADYALPTRAEIMAAFDKAIVKARGTKWEPTILTYAGELLIGIGDVPDGVARLLDAVRVSDIQVPPIDAIAELRRNGHPDPFTSAGLD